MTKWCGSIFCSVAAMRYSSSGRRPGALTVQDTSLPSALSRESSKPTRCTPTPSFAARALMRHAVGLDVMKSSTLSRKDRLVMCLLVPFGHVGELDVVADVLRARGRVDRLLHFAERLGELDAELCELNRIGFDHGGILGPEKGAAHQFDINPRRQVLGAWARCGLRGGSHDAALKGDTTHTTLNSRRARGISRVPPSTENGVGSVQGGGHGHRIEMEAPRRSRGAREPARHQH